MLETFIVCGAQRVGKSILSKSIANISGGTVVSIDSVRGKEFGSNIPKTMRKKLATSYVRRVTEQQPFNAIVEGVSVYNLCRDALAKREFSVPVYFVGFTGIYSEKRCGIELYRRTGCCWTTKKNLSERDLDRMTRHQIELSAKQRQFCNKFGYRYFEIRPNYFDLDIGSVARLILDDLHFSSDRPKT